MSGEAKKVLLEAFRREGRKQRAVEYLRAIGVAHNTPLLPPPRQYNVADFHRAPRGLQ